MVIRRSRVLLTHPKQANVLSTVQIHNRASGNVLVRFHLHPRTTHQAHVAILDLLCVRNGLPIHWGIELQLETVLLRVQKSRIWTQS